MVIGMTEDNPSLWQSLKNSAYYKVKKAVVNPEANKEAAEVKKKEEEKKEDLKKSEKFEDKKETTEPPSDPNKFSIARLFGKIWNQTTNIFTILLFPFIALMLSMLVANEMIVYSAPVRILFFIFTFFICYFFKFYAIILGLYYIIKGGYSYYVNSMTDGPKRLIMPSIFALLPISTYKPISSVGSFFMYPFTYPKSEKGIKKLDEIMENYRNQLKESFPGLEEVKNIPIFVEDLKKMNERLEHLHDIKEPEIKLNSAVNTQQLVDTPALFKPQ